jgi:hypothetical protein
MKYRNLWLMASGQERPLPKQVDLTPKYKELGCTIAGHESQGTEVLPELSALAGAVGCPRGAVEGD